MLRGFRGHLVSPSYLESRLESFVAPRDIQRRLADERHRSESLGPASSVRTILDVVVRPLTELLGLESLHAVEFVDSITVATVRAGAQHIALVLAPWDEPLDAFWRASVAHAIRRAADWAVLVNGRCLRIVDPDRPYSRRYIEFDLDIAADDDKSFAALWFVIERLKADLHALVERSDHHTIDVCRSLRSGVLSASADILGTLVRTSRQRRAIPLAECFDQALTIVYRILFLLFAEARGLVPLWHPVYRDSYSIDALRSIARQPGRRSGLWDALRAIVRLAHAGCRAGDLRVTPFNGRLFAPGRTPLAERRNLDDEAARRALVALATRPSPDHGGRKRIAYRDLGVEQLGAVYETLLDYEPRFRSQSSDAVSLERGSGVRKATGTFYTPRPIADYLVRRTLGPLVQGATSDRILRLRIVDPAMGSGAFLVAACRYLARAYEAALIAEGRTAAEIDDAERASIRRSIAERCLYGVDINPMAVQLARLSLWLATLAADRPLTFLDHHLQTGDSVLGAWLHNLRDSPTAKRRTSRATAIAPGLFDDAAVRALVKSALPVRFSLESIPDETLEDVRAKERALAMLARRDTGLSKWKRIADLWCESWLLPEASAVPAAAFHALCDAVLASRGALPDATADRYLRLAEQAAARHRLFHWELEFPEVFFDRDGNRLSNPGFDAVVGNPPWDMMRADSRSDNVRAESKDDIGRVVRFTRDAAVYGAQSSGHANRYQLFCERAIALTCHGGRIGLVLPSGLALDHGSAALRRHLLERCDVDALVGFDNHRAVFPIHRSVRFLLHTATAGSPTRSIACRLGERNPASLDAIGEQPAAASRWFPVHLTPALVHRLSGPGVAIPDLRTQTDVTIAERAASLFPPVGAADGWAARFGRELNATDDRSQFNRAARGLPVVEGKHLEPFRVHLESTTLSIARDAARRRLGAGWRERPRLAYRDVASSTNRLTLIAAVLPSGCVSTHTLFCLRTPLRSAAQWFLCGLFNSYVVNYLVRMRVTTHVTTAIVEQLPIPEQADSPRAFRLIAALARLLARRFAPAAAASLQASVAALYQLSAAEFAHVLETFPLIPKEERELALNAFVATEAKGGRR
jgi:hypothetical protein